MKKFHKVVNLKVFDFEDHDRAYALKTKKNKFGYSFQNNYYIGDKLIYNGPVYDNVEDNELYWLAFGINKDQLKSLKKRLKRIRKKDSWFQLITQDNNSINILFDNYATIDYQGKYKEEFCQKVLEYKK